MSWLISLVVAGVMFASDGNLPASVSYNFGESKPSAEKVVKADETERFEQTYPLSATGKVGVSNVNGSIAVEVWDRNEVKLEYVKTADTKENLAQVEIKIDARQDAFSVETDYGDSKRGNFGERKNYGKLQVEYHLIVPRNAILDEIETVNGSVSVAGAENSTKASAVNGQVKANNLRGTANLSTVNGTVEADFDELAAGSRISLNTVNGGANLIIPSDANATVKADTVNGNIVNDFGLPVRKGEYVGRDLYGKIGSGGAQIRLNSVNGGLSIKRKNDGKNLNPATNLLTAKNRDDWNDGEDIGNNSDTKSPGTPRTPRTPRTPKTPQTPNGNYEINKSIGESLKNSAREIERIKPQLEKMRQDALKQAAVINSPEMQARIKEAQARSKEMMARMPETFWMVGSPSIEEKSESFAVKGTPKITVEAGNYAVSVRGWDKPEVRYALTRFSKNQFQTPLVVQATQNGSDVNIKAANSEPNKDFFIESNRVRIEIFVPQKSNLKITTGGEIRLEGVSGEIDLSGAGETVNIRDSGGTLRAGTDGGRIRVIGFRGTVDAKTIDGAMNFEGDFQNLAAQTADGTIVLTLPENANANIESNQKDIQTDGLTLNYLGNGKGVPTWKIGSGGSNYRLYATADGKIIVRSAAALKAN